MVYNFRIAEITKQPTSENNNPRNHKVVTLVFDQYRKKYNGTQQNFLGGLGAYTFDFKPYYIRVDGAVSYIKERVNHQTSFLGTETDDILFTAGRNFEINKKTLLTFSGLFGIPTHQIYRLKHIDFGYSQVGTGVQLDGVYKCTHSNSLLFGTRYLYFIPRHATDSVHQKYVFTIGNVADILLAYKNTCNRHHAIELGYTWRARFGAHASPHFDDIVRKTNYLRNNFYAVYKYKFFTHKVSHRLLFNISYGFDQSPKVYGNKAIVTFWAAWNIGF